ncbi:MAG TPA: nucleotidyltransferase family protein [Gemmatimonadaceae bacterium]|nr:nucleotidyltransferase family protein [Gemmatimonadaceae bacterium]
MTSTRKAVILAAGLGTRMRQSAPGAILDPAQAELADEGLKGMIPIGRPFLDYLISALADAGVPDVCLVIGPGHTRVREYYGGEVELSRTRVQFAIQKRALGTAHALLSAEPFAGDDHVLVVNADNYYPIAALRALADLDAPGLAAFERSAMVRCGNMDPEGVTRFAVAMIDSNGMLERIIEKPDPAALESAGPEIFVGMNCWSMPPDIFRACRMIGRSPRGELELPDAVQYARDHLGVAFRVLRFHDAVLDLSSRADIAAVAAELRGVVPQL